MHKVDMQKQVGPVLVVLLVVALLLLALLYWRHLTSESLPAVSRTPSSGGALRPVRRNPGAQPESWSQPAQPPVPPRSTAPPPGLAPVAPVTPQPQPPPAQPP